MRKVSAVWGLMVVASIAACDSGAEGGHEVATVETDTLATRAESVAVVDLSTFSADPEAHEGHEIRLENVPVDSRMGTHGFWLKLPNQGLYLVRTTAESAAAVQPGRPVSAAGTIRPMADSVVTAWLAEGAITADQEMEARYATSYMDAWYVSGQQATASAAQER